MATPPTQEMGTVRQQIGETHARVEMLVAEGQRVWQELRTIKHDERNHQQVTSGRLELADRRMGEIERRIGEVEKTMRDAVDLIAKVEKPVNQLVELKSRIWRVGALLAAICGLAWMVIQPIYEAVVHRLLGTG